MIEALEIANFKRFQQLSLRLNALTVLTGLNGAGKSTVIQALHLAHQGQLDTDDFVALNGYPGLDLGQAADVLSAEATSDAIAISVTFGDGSAASWEFSGAQNPESSRLSIVDRPGRPAYPFGDRAGAFTYLAAERIGPRIALPTSPSENGCVLGEDGRFAAHVLALADRAEVDSARQHADSASPLLRPQVEAWMSRLVGPLQIEAQVVPRTGVATLNVRASSQDGWILLTNTGFGISYSLPIIVAGLVVPTGGMLIVDSPEAHLHPAAQSMIGRFFAQIAAAGVQVVVETHSDHVLNGIRRAVTANESLVHSDAVVHYFGVDPDPYELTIGPTGSMSDWPAGFFDQMDTDLGFINRARRR
ncbi:AAA family ATPase [Nocardia sp. CA-135953]|uniref:AAA family ATPase n=1 Tax=Nocardia sp. CA-135953 TaxID=3239978 RepID=UPI003D97A9A9